MIDQQVEDTTLLEDHHIQGVAEEDAQDQLQDRDLDRFLMDQKRYEEERKQK